MLWCLLLASPAWAQVVGQGAAATTSDATAWPIKVVFGGAQVDPRARTWTLGSGTDSVTLGGTLPSFGSTQTFNVGTFPDNEPVNVAQFGGGSVVTGHGPSGSGVPRVTASEENMSGSVSLSSGAACPAASATAPTTSAGCVIIPVAGYAGAGFGLQTGTLTATFDWDFSDDGGASWDNTGTAIAIVNGNQDTGSYSVTNPNPGVTGIFIVAPHWTHVRVRITSYTSGAATITLLASQLVTPLALGAITAGVLGSSAPLWANMTGLRSATSTPAAVTATTNAAATGDVYGIAYTRNDHPSRVNCNITSTETTSTTITGCTAPAAGLSIYIQSLQWSSSIISTTTNFMTIQDGTGGNCGANVTVHYRGYIPAAFNSVNINFIPPIKVDAASEVCLLHPGAGTRLVSLQGWIAP